MKLPTFIQDINVAPPELLKFILKDFLSTIENLKNEFVRITIFDESFETATIAAANLAAAQAQSMAPGESKEPTKSSFFSMLKNKVKTLKRGGGKHRRKTRRKTRRKKNT